MFRKKKIEEDDHFDRQTGYPSVDKPWLKYYSDEALNTEMPRCTAYDYLWKSNKDYLDCIVKNKSAFQLDIKPLLSRIER